MRGRRQSLKLDSSIQPSYVNINLKRVDQVLEKAKENGAEAVAREDAVEFIMCYATEGT